MKIEEIKEFDEKTLDEIRNDLEWDINTLVSENTGDGRYYESERNEMIESIISMIERAITVCDEKKEIELDELYEKMV